MAGRGHVPHGLEGHSIMQQGVFPPNHWQLDRLPPPDLLENKIAAQAAEIEQLVSDNHRLASSHVALRQDLVDAQREVERLKAHIRSIQTESDIQMRILLDKIAKMEAEIKLSENVKKELRQLHMEAQSLVKAGQEVTAQIQQASQELQKVRAEVRSLPDLQAELDNLSHEYKRLRSTFEYEKCKNIEKVKQLQAMEQSLIGMARELEKLHAEVLNAEKQTHGNAAYVDAYGRPLVQTSVGPTVDGSVPYSNGKNAAVIGGIGGTVVSSTGDVTSQGGPCNP